MTDSKNTQLDGASLNIAEQRKRELKQLFPGAFTETKNDQGELVETIDFERLKAELAEFSDIYDNRRERYGMDWPGKRDCLRLIQEPSYATLKPCREESVDFDTTQNLFIEGDNLEVLKLLQKAYYNKIKMIYIDPPYNTGKEFIYPDNYSESLETYLAYAGLADSEGKKFSTNTANEGRFHTKWLNMMYPRLYLARNLLKDDGVIFISIDDNEVENLRRMCDEIFGEENFVASLFWEKGRKNDAKLVSVGHDYILIYVRNKSHFIANDVKWREVKPGAKEILDEYIKLRSQHKEDDEAVENGIKRFYESLPRTHPSKKHSRYNKVDSKGIWRDDNMSWPGGNGPTYEVTHPSTGLPCAIPEGGWRYSTLERMMEMVNNGKVVFRADHTEPPIRKTYLLEVDSEDSQEDVEDEVDDDMPIQVAGTYFYRSALQASNELTSLFGKKVFNNPKDKDVIARWIDYVGTSPGDIILDFFAGSASTGHAVQDIASKQGKNLHFILVQLPERISEKAKGGKQTIEFLRSIGKPPVVSEIAKERLRRSGAEINLKQESQLDLEGRKLDIGFKSFMLNRSNFKQWHAVNKDIPDFELIQQMELAVDHVEPNATQEDLLYELLLKSGIKPTETITTIELAGQQVFSVAEGSLLAHLGNTVTKELIDAVLQAKPLQFICLDRAFHGNDQLKCNAVKTFENHNQSRTEDDHIAFRTV